MLDRDGYRPNVAIVIVNGKNQVFWGKRIREHSWQFPQGGINSGETPEQAMFRELREEVGLEPQHVRILGRTREWLRYDVPQHWIKREWRGSYRGQKQIWYLLRLIGRDNDVRLRASDHPEFDAWRWHDYWIPLDTRDRVQARVVPARAARTRALPVRQAPDPPAAPVRRAASRDAGLLLGSGAVDQVARGAAPSRAAIGAAHRTRGGIAAGHGGATSCSRPRASRRSSSPRGRRRPTCPR